MPMLARAGKVGVALTARRNVTIVQLNDSHGYLDSHPEMFRTGRGEVLREAGGFARIGGAIEELREQRPGGVLVLDCGDTIHGTYPTVHSRGAIMVPILNEIGFDAMTAHWEFAYGPQRFDEIVGALDYPMLAVNCYDEADGRLRYPPYTVVERGGLRIGIVGIAATIVDKVMPPHFSEGVRFTLGKDELPGHIERLKDVEGVDLVVVISHLGFPQELRLASEVDGIDVLLSGHTHNRIPRPVRVNDTVIIQSGCHGSFLGVLELAVEEGTVVDLDHRLLVVDESVPHSPEVGELVEKALAPHRDFLSEVVGSTMTPLHRYNSLESTMDNFLLDSVRRATGAAMAFSNGWRYGVPVPRGAVTVEDLYNILPVDPPISTCRLTGRELVDMMEENLERTFAANPYEQMGGFVKRTSGLRMYFKIENPEGQRIQEVFVGDTELRAKDVYEVAYVTEQGVPPGYGTDRRNLDIGGIEAMREHLSSAGAAGVDASPRGGVVAV